MLSNALQKDLLTVSDLYPKLLYSDNDGERSLTGELNIFDSVGNYVDSFDIQIILSWNYPYGFPRMFEISNKIKHIDDRHFNNDESCCVCSLQEKDIIEQRGITLKDYLKIYAVPFFANQIYFEQEGEWANGEYAHGYSGIFQYYRELFEVEEVARVTDILSAFRAKKLRRNTLCFCGSGDKIKKCHPNVYKTVNSISCSRIGDDLQILKYLINKSDNVSSL